MSGTKPGSVKMSKLKKRVTKLRAGRRNKAHFAAKTTKRIFAEQIKQNERFHKEKAMQWAEIQDWEAMQEEFERKDPSGDFIYRSIDEFAKIQAKDNEDVERWIKKSIGPIPKKEIAWRNDWALLRVVEFSRDLEHTKLLIEQFDKDKDLFKACLPVAGSYKSFQASVLGFKQEAAELAKKIKNPFKRLRFYFSWLNDIFEYKKSIDNQYLKTLGFDKPNVMAMAQRLTVNTESGERTTNSMQSVLNSIMLMEMEKAKIFERPLPDDYQKLLDDGKSTIEIEAKEVKNGNGNGKQKVKVH
jgi:hypothetical protein